MLGISQRISCLSPNPRLWWKSTEAKAKQPGISKQQQQSPVSAQQPVSMQINFADIQYYVSEVEIYVETALKISQRMSTVFFAPYYHVCTWCTLLCESAELARE